MDRAGGYVCVSLTFDLYPLTGVPPTGDVFLLQTKDRKNPLVYTVFSTSRSEFKPGDGLSYCLLLCLCVHMSVCVCVCVPDYDCVFISRLCL